MFDTFREPHFFTFSVIFSHIASIFTFSVEFFSHLATFSQIAAFSHLSATTVNNILVAHKTLSRDIHGQLKPIILCAH